MLRQPPRNRFTYLLNLYLDWAALTKRIKFCIKTEGDKIAVIHRTTTLEITQKLQGRSSLFRAAILTNRGGDCVGHDQRRPLLCLCRCEGIDESVREEREELQIRLYCVWCMRMCLWPLNIALVAQSHYWKWCTNCRKRNVFLQKVVRRNGMKQEHNNLYWATRVPQLFEVLFTFAVMNTPFRYRART